MANFLKQFEEEAIKDLPSISIYLPFPFALQEILPLDTIGFDVFSLDDLSLAKIRSRLESEAVLRLVTINFADPLQVQFAAKLLLVVGFLGATDEMGMFSLKNHFTEKLSTAISEGASFPTRDILNLVRIARVFDKEEAKRFVKDNDRVSFLRWIRDLQPIENPIVYLIDSNRSSAVRVTLFSSLFDLSVNVALSKGDQEGPLKSYDWSIDSLQRNANGKVTRLIEIPSLWDTLKSTLEGKLYLSRLNPTTNLYEDLGSFDSKVIFNLLLFQDAISSGKQEQSILGGPISFGYTLKVPSYYKNGDSKPLSIDRVQQLISDSKIKPNLKPKSIFRNRLLFSVSLV